MDDAHESPTPPPGSPRPAPPGSVPIGELIDEAALGPEPSQRAIRAALPRGWALNDDGRTARRDVRLLFREGWILVVGMLVFGSAGLGLFVMSFPRGVSGWLYAVGLVVALLFIGGLIAPAVTRALMGKRR